jgi:hypothetical protein
VLQSARAGWDRTRKLLGCRNALSRDPFHCTLPGTASGYKLHRLVRDDQNGRIGVSADQRRHCGRVDHPQALDAPHSQIRGKDRHRIAVPAHAARSRGMVDCLHEALRVDSEILVAVDAGSREDLAIDHRAKRLLCEHFAGASNALDRKAKVFRVG